VIHLAQLVGFDGDRPAGELLLAARGVFWFQRVTTLNAEPAGFAAK
jgi:hypothetical protein